MLEGEEGSAVVPHLIGRSVHTALPGGCTFPSLPIYTRVSLCCSFAGIQVTLALFVEIGISYVFIFAALRKEVQLVLYESVCAVRTQSELSLSSSACVGPSLHTDCVHSDDTSSAAFSDHSL